MPDAGLTLELSNASQYAQGLRRIKDVLTSIDGDLKGSADAFNLLNTRLGDLAKISKRLSTNSFDGIGNSIRGLIETLSRSKTKLSGIEQPLTTFANALVNVRGGTRGFATAMDRATASLEKFINTVAAININAFASQLSALNAPLSRIGTSAGGATKDIGSAASALRRLGRTPAELQGLEQFFSTRNGLFAPTNVGSIASAIKRIGTASSGATTDIGTLATGFGRLGRSTQGLQDFSKAFAGRGIFGRGDALVTENITRAVRSLGSEAGRSAEDINTLGLGFRRLGQSSAGVTELSDTFRRGLFGQNRNVRDLNTAFQALGQTAGASGSQFAQFGLGLRRVGEAAPGLREAASLFRQPIFARFDAAKNISAGLREIGTTASASSRGVAEMGRSLGNLNVEADEFSAQASGGVIEGFLSSFERTDAIAASLQFLIKAIVEGLSTGIDQADVAQIGSGLGEEFLDGVNLELGIASPAKAMIKVAKFIGDGFKLGIERLKSIKALGEKLATDFLAGFTGRIQAARTAIGQFGNQIFQGLTQPFRNAAQTFERFGQAVSNGIQGAIRVVSGFGPRVIGAIGNIFSTGVSLGRQFVEGFASQFNALRQRFSELSTELTARGKDLFQQGVQQLTAGGLAAFIQGNFAKQVADFDALINQIRVFGDIVDPAKLKGVEDAILQFSAISIFDPQSVAKGFLDLQKAGLTLDETLAFLPKTIDLATAANIGLEEATQLTLRSMLGLGLGVQDVEKVVNTLVGGANISTASVQDFGQALQFVGTGARNLGIPIEDLTAAIALLNDQNIAGERAGTGLRQLFSSLVAPTKEAQATLRQLGISVKDTEGNFVGLENLIGQFATRIAALRAKGLGDVEIIQQLSALGDENATSALLALIKTTEDGTLAFNEYAEQLGLTKTANEIATEQMKTFSGVVESLRGSLFALGAKAIRPLLNEVIGPFLTGLTAVVNKLLELPEPILAAVAAVAGLATAMISLNGVLKVAQGVFSLFGGSVLGGISSGMSLVTNLISGSGGLIAAFTALSPIILAVGGALVVGFLVFQDIADDIRNNVDGLGDAFAILQTAISETFGELGQTLGEIGALIGDIIGLFGGFVSESFNLNTSGLRDFALNLADIAERFQGLLADVREFIQIIRGGLGLAQPVEDGVTALDKMRAAQEGAAKAGQRFTTITVRGQQDALFNLARQYGTTVEELKRLNNITDPRTLRKGQEIKIPILPELSDEFDPTTFAIDAARELKSGIPLPVKPDLETFIENITQSDLFKRIFGEVDPAAIISFIRQIEGAVTEVKRVIGQVFTDIQNFIDTAFKNLQDFIENFNLQTFVENARRAFEDFIADIPGFIERAKEAVGQFVQGLLNFAGSDQVRQFFERIGAAIGDFIERTPVLRAAFNFIKRGFDLFRSAVARLIPIVRPFFEGIGSAIGGFVEKVRAFFGQIDFEAIRAKIEEVFGAIGEFVAKAVEDVRAFAEQFIQGIPGAVEDVIAFLGKAFGDVGAFFSEVFRKIQTGELFTEIQEKFQGFVDFITKFLEESGIKKAFEEIVGGIVKFIGDVKTGLETGTIFADIQTAFDNISTFFTTFLEVTGLSDAFDDIKTAFEGFISNLGGSQESFGNLATFFGIIGTLFAGAFAIIGDIFTEIAVNVLPPLGEAIKNFVDAVKDLTQGDTQNALIKFGAALGSLGKAVLGIPLGIARSLFELIDRLFGLKLGDFDTRIQQAMEGIKTLVFVLKSALEQLSRDIARRILEAQETILQLAVTAQDVFGDINPQTQLQLDTVRRARELLDTADQLGVALADAARNGDFSELFLNPKFNLDPAVIADILSGKDIGVLQQAINKALTEGDAGALEFLLPIGLNVDDPETQKRIREQVVAAIQAAVASGDTQTAIDLSALAGNLNIELPPGLGDQVVAQISTAFDNQIRAAVLIDALKGVLTPLIQPAIEVGANILEGLKTGFDQKRPEVVTAAQASVAEVLAAINTAAGTESPSTITTQTGLDIMQGLANGLQTGFGLVTPFFDQITLALQSVADAAAEMVTRTIASIIILPAALLGPILRSVTEIGLLEKAWDKAAKAAAIAEAAFMRAGKAGAAGIGGGGGGTGGGGGVEGRASGGPIQAGRVYNVMDSAFPEILEMAGRKFLIASSNGFVHAMQPMPAAVNPTSFGMPQMNGGNVTNSTSATSNDFTREYHVTINGATDPQATADAFEAKINDMERRNPANRKLTLSGRR